MCEPATPVGCAFAIFCARLSAVGSPPASSPPPTARCSQNSRLEIVILNPSITVRIANLLLAQRDLFASRIRFIGRGCYVQIVMSHITYRDRLIVFYLSAQQRLKIGGVMIGFLVGAALFQMVVELAQIFGVGHVLGRR